jgi:hypothetical protein
MLMMLLSRAGAEGSAWVDGAAKEVVSAGRRLTSRERGDDSQTAGENNHNLELSRIN